jgi:hypothetical protein
MSTPRCVHLLSADEVLAKGYRPGGYLALCGEPIDASDLPGACCPEECEVRGRLLPRVSGRGHEAQLPARTSCACAR